MTRTGSTQAILSYLRSKYRKKTLLTQMKDQQQISKCEGERVGPTANPKQDIEYLTGYFVTYRNSKRSLMMDFQIED